MRKAPMVRQPVLPLDLIDPPPSPAVDRGFTLIEITISIVILTVLALTTAMIVVPISRQQRTARESELANAAVRGVLESIQATPFSQIRGNFPSEDVIDVSALPEGELVLSYFRKDDSGETVPVLADEEADPLFIQVDLTWTSPDWGEVERTFHTVRTE
jgi:prepilin-type N-terminal cleavage/methylation domain-containing protein